MYNEYIVVLLWNSVPEEDFIVSLYLMPFFSNVCVESSCGDQISPLQTQQYAESYTYLLGEGLRIEQE